MTAPEADTIVQRIARDLNVPESFYLSPECFRARDILIRATGVSIGLDEYRVRVAVEDYMRMQQRVAA